MSKPVYVVIGSNGQLGSEIKELSNRLDIDFRFYDFPQVDITDINSLTSIIGGDSPDVVINCAAYTAVDKAETEPQLAQKVNGEGVKNIVEAARMVDAWLIHISTDYVFDGMSYKPYNEQDKTNPQSVYGRTKLTGEEAAVSYSKGIVVRTAWLYSAFGSNFVKTMLRLGNERDSLNVVFDQVGSPTYAHDLASALLTIAEKITASNDSSLSGIYHYSNEGVCSWYDFTREIFDMENIACNLYPIESVDYPTPAKRPHYSVLNKRKIKNTFGINIPHWKRSLAECLNKLNKQI